MCALDVVAEGVRESATRCSVRLVSVRELRNTPAEVWAALRSDDLVLTHNGDPVAVIARVEGGDVETTLAALRRARAQQAVSELRVAAAAAGTASMTEEEIEGEISRSRRSRPPR
jgi:hypothetical protein